MYRKRKKYSKKLQMMREAKARKRLEGPPPDYPPVLPDLRRRIIVIDYDFGEVVHQIDLHKTSRRDCYRAVVDGQTWRERIGWARVLEGIRKSFPRVGAA